MQNLPLKSFIDEHFNAYYGIFADIMKIELHRNYKDTFDLLDFDDDSIWTDPLLQTQSIYKYAPEISHLQLLYGQLSKKKRPKSLKAFSDNNGIIYLPDIGYFKTDIRNQKITFSINSSDQYILEQGNSIIPFEFFPINYYDSTKIELVQFDNDITRNIYFKLNGKQPIDIEGAFKDHKNNLVDAFTLLKETNQWLYDKILHLQKKIILFDCNKLSSFSAGSAIGLAFIKVNKDYNEISFLQEIVQQGCLNIIHLFTSNREEYFKVDAKYILANTYNKDENDKRTIYKSFLGVYTLVNIVDTFQRLLTKEFEDPHRSHEIKGRFFDNLRRIEKRINSIRYKDIYTEKGWKLLNRMEDYSISLLNKYKSEFLSQNFKGSPYLFDYKSYLELNAIS